MERLDILVPQYAHNKSEADSYKKICDEENAEIKQLLVESEQTEYTAGGYTVKYIVTVKESFDDARLLNTIKTIDPNNELGLIRTVEVIDMDALESAIYRNELSNNDLQNISDCKIKKEIPQLRLNKEKKKKEDK